MYSFRQSLHKYLDRSLVNVSSWARTFSQAELHYCRFAPKEKNCYAINLQPECQTWLCKFVNCLSRRADINKRRWTECESDPHYNASGKY